MKKRGKTEEESGVEDELPESMPYIVIIIDELADIMSAYPKELEAAIVRLAQMSRAVGIHLILSTQRPDVRVITGLIKANIPSRIALQVASQIDSRTIIDKAGAEKLLGKGDMLYQGGEMGKPSRIQSGFVTEEELKKLTSWLIKHYAEKLQDTIDFDSESRENNTDNIFSSVMESDSDDDDKYGEARETVLQAGKASTSFLQRKLGVGYSRAAKLVDMLEERGVIGPQNGTKPREVIASATTQGENENDNSPKDLYEPKDNQGGLNNERF
jgi:S-DNA-T family DNA segregation ATPase FtsK/SpoIIIE